MDHAVDSLTEIADSAAIAIGGPTLISDDRFDVIAYSRSGGDSGHLRAQAILSRRLPRELVIRLDGPGARSRGEAIRVTVADGGVALAHPIRAERKTLGHLWVTLPSELPHARTGAVLADAARRAASVMIERHLGRTADASDDALALALRGEGEPLALRTRLGGAPARLIGVDLSEPFALTGTEQRFLAAVVGLGVESDGSGIATAEASRAYALVRDEGHAAALALASRLARQLELAAGAPARAVFSETLDDLAHLPDLRARVDRCLDAPLWNGDAPVRELEDARGDEVLDRMTELFTRQPELLHRGVLRLADLDESKRSDYLHTLHVYFDCNCDVAAAARVLFVHRNTLKYRLGRISDIAAFDLTQPAERLMVELQVRYLLRRAGTRLTASGARGLPRHAELRPARAIGEIA